MHNINIKQYSFCFHFLQLFTKESSNFSNYTTLNIDATFALKLRGVCDFEPQNLNLQ